MCKEKKYRAAVPWLLEALRRNKKKERDNLEANIFETLANAYYMLSNYYCFSEMEVRQTGNEFIVFLSGDVKETLIWLQKLLHVVPEHPQYEEMSDMIKKYKYMLKAKKDATYKTVSKLKIYFKYQPVMSDENACLQRKMSWFALHQ